ncbi:AbrB family transcriptional regulator [Bacillus sp. DJP31]|uniref:AbrB family transcriptional regulator n=1 Tax=Bacillus sp. DJP31 TaxID=3409789 RepID=UPI003BB667E8
MKNHLILIETLIVGFVGGLIFTFLHLPLAWMLGSLLSTVFWRLRMKRDVLILPSMRNGALIIIGYLLGISFTYDTLLQMGKMLPAMFTTTLLLIGFSIIISIFLAKFTGITFKTALIGMMPGGFSQMVILGEELGDVDITSITLFQLIRLLSVIYLVPAIVRIDWFAEVGDRFSMLQTPLPASSMFEVILFVIVTLCSSYLAVKIKLPTPYLLGPIFGCAIFVIAGFTPFTLPEIVLIASQLFLGIHIGIMVDPNKLINWKVFGVGAISASILLIFSTIAIAGLLLWLFPISLGTAFLSAAPGGIAEMGLTAQAIGADLSIVTGFQMFRIFFILFLVPPMVLWVYRRRPSTW